MRVILRKDGSVKIVMDPRGTKLPVKIEGKENLDIVLERGRKYGGKILVSWYELVPGEGTRPYDQNPEKTKATGKIHNWTLEDSSQFLDFLNSLMDQLVYTG